MQEDIACNGARHILVLSATTGQGSYLMSTTHLDDATMERFRNRRPDDPTVLKDQWLQEYAQRAGGTTLRFWQLVLGRIWGAPIMMSADDAAKRLDMPASEGRRRADEAADAFRLYRGGDGSSTSATRQPLLE